MNLRAFKLIILTSMLIFGFFASTVDLCCDEHDASAPISQDQHCCLQCCHVRSLGPVADYAVGMQRPTEVLLGCVSDASSFFQDPFLDGLYRPPIV